MFTQLSPLKLALVLALVVLLFGAKRIPALAESIGNAIKKFKNTQKDEDKSV
jgi:sec-independent protein translocase protein TatA